MSETPDTIVVPVMFEHQKTLPQWEYQYAALELSVLNELGAEGWQVVIAVDHLPGMVLMIREILPKPEEVEAIAEPAGE